MTDFAPVDGRGVWATGTGGAVRRPVEVAGPEAKASVNAQGTLARRIVDEVEFSPEALSAQRAERPTREQVVASARERIAAGYYDRPGVLDATVDRLARDLIA